MVSVTVALLLGGTSIVAVDGVTVTPDGAAYYERAVQLIADIDELAGALSERARRHGHTLEEELRMIQEAAAQTQSSPLPPISLHTVRVGGTSTWSREEIYGDDGR